MTLVINSDLEYELRITAAFYKSNTKPPLTLIFQPSPAVHFPKTFESSH